MTLPDRLAHLPDRKRRELERVAAILFDEFDDALKTKLSMKGKRGRILGNHPLLIGGNDRHNR